MTALVLLSGGASAQNYDVIASPGSASLGETVSVVARCSGATTTGACPDSSDVNLNMCGQSFGSPSTESLSSGTVTYEFVYRIPESCSAGAQNVGFSVSGSNEASANIDVLTDLWSADYLEVKMNSDQADAFSTSGGLLNFEFFRLVNKPVSSLSGAPQGSVLVSEQETTNFLTDYFETEAGTIAKPSSADLKAIVVDLNSVNKGKTENVIEADFTSSSNSNCGTTPNGRQKCFVAEGATSSDKIYKPKGDIIIAYDKPQTENNRRKRIYLCADSAPKEKVVYVNGEQYKCDTVGVSGETSDGWRTKRDSGSGETGDWDLAPVCDDGIDNDADGKIDFENSETGISSDSGCSSPTDSSETVQTFQGGPTCEPFIGKGPNGNKAAFYDSGEGGENPLGSSCDYKIDVATTPNIGGAQKFRCSDSGEALVYADTTASTPNPSDTSKLSTSGEAWITQERVSAVENFCSGIAQRSSQLHSGTGAFDYTTAAFYRYDVSQVPYSPRAEKQQNSYISGGSPPSPDKTSSLASEFVKDTGPTSTLQKRCASRVAPGGEYSGGMVLRRCKSLHTAEQEFSSSSAVHQDYVWYAHGMTGLSDGYTSNGDYVGSWTAVNPGKQAGVISADSPIHERNGGKFAYNFSSGGFIGDCPSGTRWQYYSGDNPRIEGTWRCGQPSEKIKVGFYKLNTLDYSDGQYVGFQINASEAQKWQQAYPQSSGPVYIDASCWPGGRSVLTGPSNNIGYDDLSNVTARIQFGSTTRVGLKLKPTPNIPNLQKYTCTYGFRQPGVSKTNLLPGNRNNLFTTSGGTVQPLTGGGTGTIIEGENNLGSLVSTGVTYDLNQNINENTGNPTDVVGPSRPKTTLGPNEVYEQDFLQTQAQNSYVTQVNGPVYTDYPTSQGASGRNGFERGVGRNPLNTYLTEN